MALIDVLPTFRVNLALSQYLTIITGPNIGYVFTGRVTPWADEIDPPDPSLFSTSDYVETRLNMVSLRRLYAGLNILPGIRTIRWTEGKTYAFYDDKPSDDGISLYDKDYYVFTKDSHIFKCIWNNFGKPSTVEPFLTQNITQILDTPDGYRWKYLHTVSELDQHLYNTKKYIPLRSFVDPTFNNGGVIGGVIEDQGSGYLGGGDGIISLLPSNFVGPGSGASGFIIIRKGKIVYVTITSPGSGYDKTTKIVFDGDPPNNKLVALEALVLEFDFNLGSVFSYASMTAAGIEHCIINNRGAFFDPNNTTITFDGDGVNATGEVVLKSTTILSDITIVDRGQNILSADILITSAFGINAKARIKNIQSGRVSEVEILNHGEGFNAASNDVQISLINIVSVPGTTAIPPVLIPRLETSFVIDKINMINPGTGYRTVTAKVNGGKLSNIRPIISPIFGHGGFLPGELFSTSLLVYAPFEFEGDFGGMSGDFPIGNDLRQFGLLLAPLNKGGAPIVDPTATACYVFKLDSIENMTLDSIWTHPDDPQLRLRLVSTRTNKTGPTSFEYYAYFNSIGFSDPVINQSAQNFTDAIIQESNGLNFKNVLSITDQEVNPFSGRLIYLENRPPYSRSDSSIEIIRGAISF